MRYLYFVVAFTTAGCGETTCADEDKVFGWVDADGDGFGDSQQLMEICELKPGIVNNPDDCNDSNEAQFPFNPEVCDGLDNDCDGRTDERFVNAPYYLDEDGDGFGVGGSPTWACQPPEGTAANDLDCDDTNPNRNPSAVEICDNLDNDCDGAVDDQDSDIDPANQSVWYPDTDGDTYGDPDNPVSRCNQPATTVTNSDDCDDTRPMINPLGTEICNGLDDQCDGLIDDDDPALDQSTLNTFYEDFDGDGLGNPLVSIDQCAPVAGYVPNPDDCNDDDGLIRGPDSYLADADGDGYGVSPVVLQDCGDPGPGFALASLGNDCDDSDPSSNPGATEFCDSMDNNCDGLVDDNDPALDPSGATLYFIDMDQDGYGDPLNSIAACLQISLYSTNDQDCDDFDASINPDGLEVCDGADNNCDTLVDDDDPSVDPFTYSLWYADLDGDGFGDLTTPWASCDAPPDYLPDSTDCNDGDPNLGPPVLWYADADADGVGAGPLLAASCMPPQPDAVPSLGVADCDDADPTVFPGNIEDCADGIDSDCNGLDDCPLFIDSFELGFLDPLYWNVIINEADVVTSPVWDGSYSARLGGLGSSIASDSIDSTACSSVTWSFWGRRGPEAPDVGDVLFLEWFDGSDWNADLAWYGSAVGDSTFVYHSGEILAPAALRPDFRVRISTMGSASGIDQFYVDQLILGCPP